MARLLQMLPVAAVVAFAAVTVSGRSFANGSDDDKKETVESRLLKILKDRGVLKEDEFNELTQLANKMRAEDSMTSVALEKELAELAARVERNAQDKKEGPPEVKVSYRPGKGL